MSGLSVTDVSGIGAISNLVQDIADKIWPDPAAKAAGLLKVQELDNQMAAGQAAIDQVEAANNSLFVSGWRPFVGWACGFAFVYHLILQPFLAFIIANTGHTVVLPDFDTSTLTTTLYGILGLGVLHENSQGNLPWNK